MRPTRKPISELNRLLLSEISMSNTTKMNKTAPFLSIAAFGQEDKIEEHYKMWLQYEVGQMHGRHGSL